MTPMVFMSLKWEKELERPDWSLIQWRIFSRLLKTKEKRQLEGKGANDTRTRTQCTFSDLGAYQTSTNYKGKP